MKKVELLSPAGNFEALKGVLKAGADAVYLGGQRYGARAYADNFTQDEICEGIHLAHVFGRKIYLTVNTLVKERELDELYDFLLPFYECGLDGVILQDLGVLRFIRSCFPRLPLHASTQMTITGSEGARLAMGEGISRIVPARELSLEEIRQIKRKTGVEIEIFIHGAMCYCYSGQCLFSSILGGRSGNRGRCAQPCRLPYRLENGTEQYLLSMKDMCTINLLPELIEAGADSFKIEGRMKDPAYGAGVTAIYRKYIDLYYRNREAYEVLEEDLNLLQSLYIRSETGEGYYRRHNGREMISLSSPAYSKTSEELLAVIRKNYMENSLSRPAEAEIVLKAGAPADLLLKTEDCSVSCTGETVQTAQKQPLTEEKVREQIRKSGNSLIDIRKVDVKLEGAVFMQVRSLNELRRKAVAALEEELIRRKGLSYEDRAALSPEELLKEREGKDSEGAGQENRQGKALEQTPPCLTGQHSAGKLHVSVLTRGQLKAALEEKPGRIYIDYGLFSEEIGPESGDRKQKSTGAVDCSWMREKAAQAGTELYVALPYIVREKDMPCMEMLLEMLRAGMVDGVLARNLESIQFFQGRLSGERIAADAGLYTWNREALLFWEGRVKEVYLPLECNGREWRELMAGGKKKSVKTSAVVYGRLPMMVSANCVRKTAGKCTGKAGMTFIKDRYAKEFPVYTDCHCCYNIIYNSVPLSLHRFFGEKHFPEGNFRLDFTVESEEEASRVFRYFDGLSDCYREPAYKEYTAGHYKRGVE